MDTVYNTERLFAALHTNGLSAELKVITGAKHGFEPGRGVVFRNIGEYCLTHLAGNSALQNYHSIARWKAATLPVWLFCVPAIACAFSWLVCAWSTKSNAFDRIHLIHHEIVLSWLALLLAVVALVETGIHQITPQFSVSGKTIAIARRFLVRPKECSDFDYLATQPAWRGKKLKNLLEHCELADYNRELINWQLEDKLFQDFVLSPIITGEVDEKFNWRRPLWEEFYPRIRHESSTENAAVIVVRHLLERVTIAKAQNLPHDVPAIWLFQITDESGFQIICVAALRSAGIPARLNSSGHAELLSDGKWQPVPKTAVLGWFAPIET